MTKSKTGLTLQRQNLELAFRLWIEDWTSERMHQNLVQGIYASTSIHHQMGVRSFLLIIESFTLGQEKAH